MSRQWRGSPWYSKLETDTDASDNTPWTKSIGPFTVLASIFCIFVFSTGWMFGSASARSTATLNNVIPSLPITGLSRQRVMARPEMQATPPADGSHEPAWDKLIPSESILRKLDALLSSIGGLGYVKNLDLSPDVSVIAVFHQLHCLYTIRRAYYAAYAASTGQEFNHAGVREPEHIAHCFDYMQQTLVCVADIGIEPLDQGHNPDIIFERQCRDFGEIQEWAAHWRVMNGSGFIFDAPLPVTVANKA
ncbi:hypothetical protein F4808DRAFT_473851 [Astrocystis sublimbata]|nr:hypothetical protein F4808DRAFT_473851 [Astrocystis sublimbata]